MSDREGQGSTPSHKSDMTEEDDPVTPIASPSPSPPSTPPPTPTPITELPSYEESVEEEDERKVDGDGDDLEGESALVPEKPVTPKKVEEEDDNPWKMTPEEYELNASEVKKAVPLAKSSQSGTERRPSALDPRINRGATAEMSEIQRKRQIVWAGSSVVGPETEAMKKRRLRFGGDLDPPSVIVAPQSSAAAKKDENVSLDDVIVSRNITYNKPKKAYTLKEGDVVEDLEPLEELDYDYDTS